MVIVESITPFKIPFRIYPGFGTQFLFNHSSAYENCSFSLVNKYLLSAFPRARNSDQLGFLLEEGAGIWGGHLRQAKWQGWSTGMVTAWPLIGALDRLFLFDDYKPSF